MTIDEHINRVLIIGNGFDLYHELPTSYKNFVDILKILKRKGGKITCKEINSVIPNFAFNVEFDESECNEDITFENFVESNFWTNYFIKKYGDNKTTWIDLENDILAYLTQLELIYDEILEFLKVRKIDNSLNMFHVSYADGKIAHNNQKKCKYSMFTENFFEDYQNKFGIYKRNLIDEISSYYYKKYWESAHDRILKIDDLHKILLEELQSFNLMLTEYLEYFSEGFVCEENRKIKNFIIEENFDFIVSFNYTETFLKYKNISKAEIFYIHGNIYDKIILGLSDASNAPTRFKKSYLRSLNGLYDYDILEGCEILDIHIFGHSLDVSDEMFFKELFILNKKNHFANYNIYYRNFEQKADLLNNIIRIIGMDYYNILVKKGRFNLIECEDTINTKL